MTWNNLDKFARQTQELSEACRRMAELGYVASAGGNLSLRADEEVILITPTKAPKRFVSPGDVCAVDPDGNVLFAPPGKRPTGETPFHVRIFRRRPDIRGIVHAHPPVLTGFALAGCGLLERPLLPEPVLELGPVLNIPYAEPLSEALALAFDRVIEHSDAFLMENHGALVCSEDGAADAAERMQMLECMAVSALTAQLLGGARPLGEEDLERLEHVRRTRELSSPGGHGKSYRELFRDTTKIDRNRS